MFKTEETWDQDCLDIYEVNSITNFEMPNFSALENCTLVALQNYFFIDNLRWSRQFSTNKQKFEPQTPLKIKNMKNKVPLILSLRREFIEFALGQAI